MACRLASESTSSPLSVARCCSSVSQFSVPSQKMRLMPRHGFATRAGEPAGQDLDGGVELDAVSPHNLREYRPCRSAHAALRQVAASIANAWNAPWLDLALNGRAHDEGPDTDRELAQTESPRP